MSYNLDLRSKRYINRQNFLRKRILWIFLAIFLLLSPALCYTGLDHYHQALLNRSAKLEDEVNLLRQDAEPLVTITDNLADLEARRQLIDQLKLLSEKWSAGLHLLYDAVPAETTITEIELSSGGIVSIEGISLDLQSPAQYRQNLDDLSLFKQTELKIATLNSKQSYTFQIKARLSEGDELDGKKEKIAIQ